MKKKDHDHTGYVQQLHEETRRYVEDLFAENERLRLSATSLEIEKRQTELQLLAVTAELDHARYEKDKLVEQFDNIQSERARYYEHYLSLEQQHASLANLYVASYRLHGTLDRGELIGVIQEIVINLIGSEELAIFECDSAGALSVAASVGIDAESCERAASRSPQLRDAAQTGEIWIAEQAAEAPGQLTACVPLCADDRVAGVIAIFRLLPQKTGLEPLDRELFELLGSHAGTALYLAHLHAEARQAAL